jgi:hypothetical protein
LCFSRTHLRRSRQPHHATVLLAGHTFAFTPTFATLLVFNRCNSTDINRSSPGLPALNTRYNQHPTARRNISQLSLKPFRYDFLRRLPNPTANVHLSKENPITISQGLIIRSSRHRRLPAWLEYLPVRLRKQSFVRKGEEFGTKTHQGRDCKVRKNCQSSYSPCHPSSSLDWALSLHPHITLRPGAPLD